jgi:hypothetical protein
LEVLEVNEVKFDSGWLKCLWFTNTRDDESIVDSVSYVLFDEG